MTREIKFRAWDKKVKLMIPPFDLKVLADGEFIAEAEIENLIFMQFTGLKDKNGNEIYEGDIVLNFGDLYEHTDKYWEIYFSNGSFWMKTLNKISITTIKKIPVNSQMESNYVEIIGNIYENPNLLP